MNAIDSVSHLWSRVPVACGATFTGIDAGGRSMEVDIWSPPLQTLRQDAVETVTANPDEDTLSCAQELVRAGRFQQEQLRECLLRANRWPTPAKHAFRNYRRSARPAQGSKSNQRGKLAFCTLRQDFTVFTTTQCDYGMLVRRSTGIFNRNRRQQNHNIRATVFCISLQRCKCRH